MTRRLIRVLHVVSTGRTGGAESFVEDLAGHLDRDRFEISVCIVADDGPVGDRLRSAGCRVFTLGSGARLSAAGGAAFMRNALANPFDILHLNGGGASLRLLARISGCRSTITYIHGFPNDWVENIRGGRASFARTFARTYGWGSHRIVVTSGHMEGILLSQCPSLASRVERIPLGVDLERFRPSTDAPDAIGFVGRLSPEKGISEFLAASTAVLHQEPNARFIIAGDGVLRPEVQAAHANPGSHVTWLGERSDVEAVLGLAGIVAVPSRIEMFGKVCLEAMACSRPVVAFKVGGIPEIVTHDETGILVPAGDIQGLIAALVELLRRPDERRRLGHAARARVESLFDLKKMVRSVESLYERVVAS